MVCCYYKISEELLIYYKSSPDSPYCATYQFSYDDLPYSILRCASTSGHLRIRPLPYLPTYAQLPETISPSLTSTSPSSPTATSSQPASTRKEIKVQLVIGLTVGVPALLVVLMTLFTMYCRRRRKFVIKRTRRHTVWHYNPSLVSRDELPHQNHLSLAFSNSEKQSSFFPPQRGLSIDQWKLRYLHSTSKETKFLTFLASYGPYGVSLRDLIMLGTLRQSMDRSKNHWLVNGEVGSLEEAMHIILPESRDRSLFLDDFIDAVCYSSGIEHFQSRLKDLGLIEVCYPKRTPLDAKGTPSNVASQYWYTDERIWKLPGDQSSEAKSSIDDPIVLRELLDVFMDMPDKDVSPAAQRQREVYYHHAGVHIRRILQSLGDHRLLHLEAVFVVLQLLTHHYKQGDAALLNFVRKTSIPVPYSRMDMMLLWAELKENAFLRDYNGLCTIRDRLADLMTSNGESSRTIELENGLLGFLLVDLMKSAKAACFEDILSDAVKAGTEWVDRISTTKSTLEKTALCGALAAFNIHDKKDMIPQGCYLLYGYHLSRVGLLAQGDQFLSSGLKRHLTPQWSYEFERISIALRLGRRNQAAHMLDSLKRLALYNKDNGHHPNLWKSSGECAEVFITLNLYEADYCASADRLGDACVKLKTGINIASTGDAFIQTLRIALEMRLLETRMWQQNLKEALPVALDLMRGILDGRTHSISASHIHYGIVQQLLNLSNTLLSAGDAAGSLRLLEDVTNIETHLPDLLSKELKSYIQQRMGTVRRFRAKNNLSRHESNMRMLDTRIEDVISQSPAHLEHDLVTLETDVNQCKLLEPQPPEPQPSEPKPSEPKLSKPKPLRVQRLASTYNQIRRMLHQAPPAPITGPDISRTSFLEMPSLREQGSPQTKIEPFTAVPESN